MLNELKERKLTKLFSIYDANNNGVLEREDIEEIVQNLAKFRGWERGSSEYDTLYSKYIFYWERVQDAADENRDNKVTLDEWFKYHEAMLSAKDRYEEEVGSLVALIFEVFDADNDGKMSIKEWEEVFKIYNTPVVFVRYIFPKLDLNGDSFLSKEEVLQMMHEFHFSDDPNACGNYMLGPY